MSVEVEGQAEFRPAGTAPSSFKDNPSTSSATPAKARACTQVEARPASTPPQPFAAASCRSTRTPRQFVEGPWRCVGEPLSREVVWSCRLRGRPDSRTCRLGQVASMTTQRTAHARGRCRRNPVCPTPVPLAVFLSPAITVRPTFRARRRHGARLRTDGVHLRGQPCTRKTKS